MEFLTDRGWGKANEYDEKLQRFLDDARTYGVDATTLGRLDCSAA